MNLSFRAQALSPAATLAIGAKALDLKRQGKNIISLSVGEPDFPTPAHICDAAKKAIDNGYTKYTAVPGIPELRAAVSEYYKSFYNVNSSIENVIISNGGKHCLYNLCQVLFNPGDQVIIPAPYWVSYPAMVELSEAKAAIVPTTVEKKFKITPTELEKNRTPKTKAVILNSPSNPTGACYTQAELNAIAQWAVDKGIIIISDEIYDRLVFSPMEPTSLAPWWEKYPDNFVIVNGVAKTFAMTGWRVGYTLASPEVINALSRLQGQSTSNVCTISQWAAVAALRGSYEEVGIMCESFDNRRKKAFEIIQSWPDVSCSEPLGGFYLFPDMHAHFTEAFPDSATLCSYLLDEIGVAMVPGVAFGNDNCIRITYAVEENQLISALKSIERVLFHKK